MSRPGFDAVFMDIPDAAADDRLSQRDAGMDADPASDDDAGMPPMGAAPMTPLSGPGCGRAQLQEGIDRYFSALASGDWAAAPLAPEVRATEQGQEVSFSEGLYATQPLLKFANSVLDMGQCQSLSEVVLDEQGADVIASVRLKIEQGLIAEVESLLVRSADRFDPEALQETDLSMWQTSVQASARATRGQLVTAVDAYLDVFGMGWGSPALFSMCDRRHNGYSTSAATCVPTDSTALVWQRRYSAVDEETGMVGVMAGYGTRKLSTFVIKVVSSDVMYVDQVVTAGTEFGW